MEKEFTCAACGKKFMDELDESLEKAVKFSMCLECGKKQDEFMYRKSN